MLVPRGGPSSAHSLSSPSQSPARAILCLTFGCSHFYFSFKVNPFPWGLPRPSYLTTETGLCSGRSPSPRRVSDAACAEGRAGRGSDTQNVSSRLFWPWGSQEVPQGGPLGIGQGQARLAGPPGSPTLLNQNTLLWSVLCGFI